MGWAKKYPKGWEGVNAAKKHLLEPDQGHKTSLGKGGELSLGGKKAGKRAGESSPLRDSPLFGSCVTWGEGKTSKALSALETKRAY